MLIISKTTIANITIFLFLILSGLTLYFSSFVEHIFESDASIPYYSYQFALSSISQHQSKTISKAVSKSYSFSFVISFKSIHILLNDAPFLAGHSTH